MSKKTYEQWLVVRREVDIYDYDKCRGPSDFISYFIPHDFTSHLISYGNIEIKVVLAYPGDQPIGFAFINNDKFNIPIFLTGYDTCIYEKYIEKHTEGLKVIKHVKKFETFMQDVLNGKIKVGQ
ncbi:MAG: hypothetical protein E6R13_09220 [Spirochaetes bacterium]|nr:MAG: hypothetical protein E6R13_09220 [Spirochaetota bacterium]